MDTQPPLINHIPGPGLNALVLSCYLPMPSPLAGGYGLAQASLRRIGSCRALLSEAHQLQSDCG